MVCELNVVAVDKTNDLANSSRYQAQERKLRSPCSGRQKDSEAGKIRNEKISRDMGIDGNGILGRRR